MGLYMVSCSQQSKCLNISIVSRAEGHMSSMASLNKHLSVNIGVFCPLVITDGVKSDQLSSGKIRPKIADVAERAASHYYYSHCKKFLE